MSFPTQEAQDYPSATPLVPGSAAADSLAAFTTPPISTVSASETSVVDLYVADGNASHGANYPTETCVRGGASYQQLDAGSELGSNDKEIDGKMNGTVCTKVLLVQAKIREVSRRIIDRMRSCF